MSPTGLTDWLLESSIPSIRYLTLHNLLDRPNSDSDVLAARQAIMQTGPVPKILAKQTTTGQWSNEQSYYTPKYVSTHWSMLLLTELAADPQDARLQQGVEFMLGATKERVVISHTPEEQDFGCMWGNLVRYAAYCGRTDDPRAAEIIQTIVLASQDRGWGCRVNDQLPCSWGAIRALWGLAGLPENLRTPDVKAAIESGVKFIFDSEESLPNGDYPRKGKIHKVWSQVNFPLFYQADILLALRTAVELGVLHLPGAQAALAWLKQHQGDDGRWGGASPFRSRTWGAIGNANEVNRWVSLQAAVVLKQAGAA